MEENTGNTRLHYFDGLRAIACMMILFHHTVTSTLVEILSAHHMTALAKIIYDFTQSGVELFFLLSGILLLRPYFKGTKKFDGIVYCKRRFARIYFPYFFAVWFAGIVIWINTFWPTWYSAILIDFTPEAFVRQFLLFNWKGDYYNLAWWSLQIEVMFYMVVPLIVYTGKKWKLLPVIVITLLLSIILQWLTLTYFPQQYSVKSIVLGPFRVVDYLFCFAFGILLAKEDFDHFTASSAILMAVVLRVASFWYEPFNHMSWAFFYFGILIIVFKSQALQSRLSSPMMIWLGERSYSLFLVHFSVLYLTNYFISYFILERSLLYGIWSRVLGIVFSFFTAMILFYWVERKQARGLETDHRFWPPLE